ncbi:hypothetical protein C5167_048594 [Papaver somniferum]|uniref:Uncharacterized protein n=1 Tax=Papaver somniferum TaxID=3469 RepID=A0A4Y7KIE0_PAPSO|nr:hypothetical protein C5167_048594 [Papaver somniferum]
MSRCWVVKLNWMHLMPQRRVQSYKPPKSVLLTLMFR